MALEVASLYAKLGLDKDEFVSGLSSSKESISGFGGAMGGMVDGAARGFSGLQTVAMVAGGALVAGAGALGAALFKSVGAAMQAQAGQAELAAVLESTGGKAGMTADAVNELASRFQTLTPFEDDVVLAGENMLLTFTNIGKDVFPQATEAMLNMGQKFGSVDAAAVQLGKALNDPIAGVTALRKWGVTLTDAQEESIKAFMAQGDIASAQKIILGELETEFGGLAVAAGQTLTGKLEILKNSFGDMQEKIGGAFIPILTQVADLLITGLNSDVVQTALSNVANTVENLTSTIGKFSSNLQEGMSPMDSFIEAIDGLVPQGVTDALVNLRDDILPGLSAFFTNNVQPIIDFVTQNVELRDVLMAAGVVVASIVLPALAGIVIAAAPVVAVGAALVGAIALARTAWENDWGGIQGKVAAAVAFIGPKMQELKDWFTNTAVPAIQDFGVKVGEFAAAAAPKIQEFIDAAVPKLKEMGDWFTNTAVPAIQDFGAKVGEFAAAAGPKIQEFFNNVKPYLAEAWLKWNELSTWFKMTGEPAIRQFAANAAQWIKEFIDKARPIIEEFSKNWEEKAKPALDKVSEAIGRIVNDIGVILKPIMDGSTKDFSIMDAILGGLEKTLGLVVIAIEGIGKAFDSIAWVFDRVAEAVKIFTDLKNQIQQIADIIHSGNFNILGGISGALGLPGFDTGGVVAGPTGSPQLVMAHGGETIIPTHKQNGGGQAGNTFNISINANDSAGGQRAADAFVSTLRARGMVTI